MDNYNDTLLPLINMEPFANFGTVRDLWRFTSSSWEEHIGFSEDDDPTIDGMIDIFQILKEQNIKKKKFIYNLSIYIYIYIHTKIRF